MLKFDDKHSALLQEIYFATSSGGYITYEELQNNTGMSIYDMQPVIEDLKERIYIFQEPEGFQIAPEGNHYARSLWL